MLESDAVVCVPVLRSSTVRYADEEDTGGDFLEKTGANGKVVLSDSEFPISVSVYFV